MLTQPVCVDYIISDISEWQNTSQLSFDRAFCFSLHKHNILIQNVYESAH